jgi:alpha-N-arabinofuranosidase
MCALIFDPEEGEKGGIAIIKAMNHQIRFEITKEKNIRKIRVIQLETEYNHPPFIPDFVCENKVTELTTAVFEENEIVLKIVIGREVLFYYGENEENMNLLLKLEKRKTESEKIGCLGGTIIGMFANSVNTDSKNKAIFRWFSMEEIYE